MAKLNANDLIGKNFIDVLHLLEENTRIAIGGSESSGFFYFGKACNCLEEVNVLKNRILSDLEIMLKENNSSSRQRYYSNRKRLIEDFDLLNATVVDVRNKMFDADISIIIDDYMLPSYWFKDEYDRNKIFGESIGELYRRFPELNGKYDMV